MTSRLLTVFANGGGDSTWAGISHEYEHDEVNDIYYITIERGSVLEDLIDDWGNPTLAENTFEGFYFDKALTKGVDDEMIFNIDFTIHVKWTPTE
jgi:hypothetical protein